jgi:hypothetical protein
MSEGTGAPASLVRRSFDAFTNETGSKQSSCAVFVSISTVLVQDGPKAGIREEAAARGRFRIVCHLDFLSPSMSTSVRFGVLLTEPGRQTIDAFAAAAGGYRSDKASFTVASAP